MFIHLIVSLWGINRLVLTGLDIDCKGYMLMVHEKSVLKTCKVCKEGYNIFLQNCCRHSLLIHLQLPLKWSGSVILSCLIWYVMIKFCSRQTSCKLSAYTEQCRGEGVVCTNINFKKHQLTSHIRPFSPQQLMILKWPVCHFECFPDCLILRGQRTREHSSQGVWWLL